MTEHLWIAKGHLTSLAALALVTEEQDWSFSLREVARRAGVSHNAPYNHFAEKRDLFGAVAAVGFEMLRSRMLEALGKIRGADAALPTVEPIIGAYAGMFPQIGRPFAITGYITRLREYQPGAKAAMTQAFCRADIIVDKNSTRRNRIRQFGKVVRYHDPFE